MFDRLLAHDGVVEICELRSRFGFMAFHGGNLERVTDTVASEAAARSGASLYAVLQPPGLRWHVPSTDVGRVGSPALRRFLDHVDVVVAVHGYGRAGFFTALLVGGGNRVLAGHVGRHLRDALPAYRVLDDLEAIPGPLRGVHPDNPVNLPRGGGVQLELPPRVRGLAPLRLHWPGHPGRWPHVEALITALAAAATSWSAGPGSEPGGSR
ncbi:MAG TPA: poly-gamma-glutamate hydrolase family protein [Acidimicrobiales bacterium]|nr:poly-gamma-glutamate hydrolase family protein [Acidimicrobiales bacterium]